MTPADGAAEVGGRLLHIPWTPGGTLWLRRRLVSEVLDLDLSLMLVAVDAAAVVARAGGGVLAE